MGAALTVATWNTRWATMNTERGRRVAAHLEAADPDIMVVTEGAHELLPGGRHAVDAGAGADWGYASKPNTGFLGSRYWG